ncbi:MAG: DUF433 domain-containing protein [Firmicutes bacterium]|nr:DUF433 domain-containing protein [Bacillota bacterium]
MAMVQNEITDGRIVTDPRILNGKPVIRGTRISVAFILECLAGMSKNEILESYPALSEEDIEAALHHAAKILHETRDVR